MKSLLLTNTDGKPSYSLTMAVLAFAATLLWFVLSIFTHIKGFEIRAFDGTGAMCFLAPILANYYGGKSLDAAKPRVDSTATSIIASSEDK